MNRNTPPTVRLSVIPRILAVILALAAGLGLAAPVQALDTAPWDRVLRAHAHRGGVDYAALEADAGARRDLDRFVAAVGQMDEDESLGPWLDAYNALVVHAIVQRYPIASVRDVDGFFDRQTFLVAGRQRTLDHVENRIIRPRFRDARIHFALNCGAVSCPSLHGRALSRGDLDATLDRLARAALQSRQNVRARDGRLYVTQLFEWFRDDFVRDGTTVVGWMRRFRPELPVEGATDADLQYLRYDWRLNDRPR